MFHTPRFIGGILLLKLCVFNFFTCLSSSAAGSNGFGEKLYHLDLRAISASRPLHDLYYKDSKGYQALSIPNGAPSAVFEYHGPTPFTVYSKNTVMGPQGEQAVWQPRLNLSLAELNNSSYLLIFFEDKIPDQLFCLPIADDFKSVPVGSYILMNQTGATLGVKLSDATSIIAPAESKMVTVNDEEKVLPVAFAQLDKEGVWQKAYQSSWFREKGARSIVIIIKDRKRAGKLGFVRIVDYAQAPPRFAEGNENS